MNEVDVKNMIDQSVNAVVSELKKSGMIRENKMTPFQKVEALLYNYNEFQKAIKDKEEQIEELRHFGTRKHISSGMCGSVGFVDVKSEAEKTEDQIELVEYNIQTTRKFIKILDDALDQLKEDSYFDIIPMKYFQRQTMEAIAEALDCDVTTIRRNKNRLINLLQIRLFSDEVIEDIFAS